MKILILGDFSSAGRFLASGFESLGCHVNHVGLPNGWRKNPLQKSLLSDKKGLLGKFETYTNCLTFHKKKTYDLCIILSPNPFPLIINFSILKRIRNSVRKIAYWVTGCDSQFANWGIRFNQELCLPCLVYDQKSSTCKCLSQRYKNNEYRVLDLMDFIVPCSFEYDASRGTSEKIKTSIPLCVPRQPKFLPEALNTIFHGLNRYGFKGTYLVEKSFEKLKNNFPSKKFIIDGKLPYKDYTIILQNTDCIVDQIFNRSLGINSLLALSIGKVLIAGNISEAEHLFQTPKTPMIGIKPCSQDLTEKLTQILENPEYFLQIAREGPEFVDKYYSPIKSAEKFLGLLQ